MPQQIIQAKCLLRISLTDAYFITQWGYFFFKYLNSFQFESHAHATQGSVSQYLIFLRRRDALQCAQRASY